MLSRARRLGAAALRTAGVRAVRFAAHARPYAAVAKADAQARTHTASPGVSAQSTQANAPLTSGVAGVAQHIATALATHARTYVHTTQQLSTRTATRATGGHCHRHGAGAGGGGGGPANNRYWLAAAAFTSLAVWDWLWSTSPPAITAKRLKELRDLNVLNATREVGTGPVSVIRPITYASMMTANPKLCLDDRRALMMDILNEKLDAVMSGTAAGRTDISVTIVGSRGVGKSYVLWKWIDQARAVYGQQIVAVYWNAEYSDTSLRLADVLRAAAVADGVTAAANAQTAVDVWTELHSAGKRLLVVIDESQALWKANDAADLGAIQTLGSAGGGAAMFVLSGSSGDLVNLVKKNPFNDVRLALEYPLVKHSNTPDLNGTKFRTTEMELDSSPAAVDDRAAKILGVTDAADRAALAPVLWLMLDRNPRAYAQHRGLVDRLRQRSREHKELSAAAYRDIIAAEPDIGMAERPPPASSPEGALYLELVRELVKANAGVLDGIIQRKVPHLSDVQLGYEKVRGLTASEVDGVISRVNRELKPVLPLTRQSADHLVWQRHFTRSMQCVWAPSPFALLTWHLTLNRSGDEDAEHLQLLIAAAPAVIDFGKWMAEHVPAASAKPKARA